MRKYNFDVRFIGEERRDVCCRVRLDPRFNARDMTGDFPSNVTSRFLNLALVPPGGGSFTFRAGANNAVEIIAPNAMRPLSDSERAILLNLIDFGQDFESERSTTVGSVEFSAADPQSLSAAVLLKALEAENHAAVAVMNARMVQFGSKDEDAGSEWPDEDHDRFVFQIRFVAQDRISSAIGTELRQLLEVLHEANMWTGYNDGTDAMDSVQSGRTGAAFEVEIEDAAVMFIVERPPCNPALPLERFWQHFERRVGAAADGTEIFVSAAD